MLVADAFDGDIAADIAFRQRADDIADIIALRVDGDDIGDDAFRQFKPRVVEVGDEKLRGAGCPCSQKRQHADRAGAGDQNAVAGGHAAAVAGIDGNGGRLDKGCFLIGHLVRDFLDVVFVDEGELCAEMKKATIGEIVALARHDERLDRHAVAGLDGGYALADRLDNAAEFVAENLRTVGSRGRMRLGRYEDRTVAVFVKIGPANTDEAVADQNLAWTRLSGFGNVLETQVLGCMKSERAHVSSLGCF
jgi:hypothetical protein